MANKHKGEVDLVLGGKAYTLRPTFEALVEFEDKAGVTAYEVMRDLSTGKPAGFKVIAAALWSGIRGGWNGHDRAPSFVEIGEAIRKEGIASILPQFGEYLANSLSSESDLKRAAEATPPGKEAGQKEATG
jgi:hypothetical protein